MCHIASPVGQTPLLKKESSRCRGPESAPGEKTERLASDAKRGQFGVGRGGGAGLGRGGGRVGAMRADNKRRQPVRGPLVRQNR